MENAMAKVSLTSRLLDFLGRALIGSPEKLGLGDEFEDFYFMPGERQLDEVKDPRKRLTVNHLRFLLFKRVAVLASAMSFVLCLGGVLALVSMRGIVVATRAAQLNATLATADCAELRKTYYTMPLTLAQLQALHARCDGR
jgi:hypothetical protein